MDTPSGMTPKQVAVNLFSGFLAASIVLLSTMALAQRVADSKLFRQSRLATSILSQESMNMMGLVSDPKKFEVFIKFLGAVTTAYINFEMIPVNEARTFVVIFESLDDSVEIENFIYQGKKLIITGTAEDEAACESFRDTLEAKNYFASVSLHRYTTVDDAVRFELECASNESRSYIELAQELIPQGNGH